jgi:hypothetical protein
MKDEGQGLRKEFFTPRRDWIGESVLRGAAAPCRRPSYGTNSDTAATPGRFSRDRLCETEHAGVDVQGNRR